MGHATRTARSCLLTSLREFPTVAGASVGYELSLAEQQGACLYIPHDAKQETISRTKNVTDYLKAHWRTWNTHALETIGLDMPKDGPILVNGYQKTTEWTVAAARASAVEHSAHVEAGGAIRAVGNVHLQWTQSAQATTSVQSRSGPRQRVGPRNPQIDDSINLDAHVHAQASEAHGTGTAASSSDSGPTHDQSIFLRYYKVRPRLWYLKIVAAAGPAQLPPPDPAADEPHVPADDSPLDVSSESAPSLVSSTSPFVLDLADHIAVP